jgi:catechol 2,3-dioxygenase-like lactoylglutathione lyase family enzyme
MALPVEELEASVRFYRAALGLEVAQRGRGWVVMRDLDTGQQLCLKESGTHAHPAMSLQCSDFESALAHLEEAGAVEVYTEVGDTFKHATVRDPDGHEIFLWWEG